MVSEGFRWFNEEKIKHLNKDNFSENDSDVDEQRFWLEASTFSNAGDEVSGKLIANQLAGSQYQNNQ